ncbi:hypothetical protein ACOSQ2_020338 [Xanthoceras sorbifolium]
MASENLDQHSDDRCVQQLHVVIKELKYHDTMDVKYLLNYPGENETSSELLSDEQIIENVMENDKEDKLKTIVLYWSLSCAKMHPKQQSHANFLLQYENTTLELLMH